MRSPLARRLEGFGTTIFTEMTRLAIEHGAVNLAQGFPDFDGPEFAKEAAIAAIREGEGQYARMTGIPDIHAALSAKYRRDYGLDYAEGEELTVTSGATEAIFAAIQGTCGPGDEVILFEPYYDSYKASVRMAGARPRIVTLHAPTGASIPTSSRARSRRRRARSSSTRRTTRRARCSRARSSRRSPRSAASATSSASPTRSTSTSSTKGRHVPMATLPGMRERTITISSFGKTFSLTGWKIGWAAAPAAADGRRPRRAPVRHVRDGDAASARGGRGADGRAGVLPAARATPTGRKRDYLVARARADRLRRDRRPAGTYFVCADFRPLGFERRRRVLPDLIEKIGVAAIPPSRLLRPQAPRQDATRASRSARRTRRSKTRGRRGSGAR